MYDLQCIPRWLEATVEQALQELHVVVVSGARQTGKTTMVCSMAPARQRRLESLMASAPRRGTFLENLLLASVDAWRETVTPRPEAYFWRTASGTEVDLVVVQGRRALPIEVKASSQARPSDAEPVERFIECCRDASWGIVAYAGQDVVPLSARVLAVPIALLL